MPSLSRRLLGALLLALIGGAAGEIEIVSGPGPNSTLVCDEFWIAWENNTAPFYDHLVYDYDYDYEVEINDSFVNVTYYYYEHYIQVLQGSMPVIPIVYYEEGENGTRGRPVICFTPPGTDLPVEETENTDSTPLVVAIYTISSLAIIASVVALATYILLPTLRTLPGWVIMNLFVAFLLGDIMLQVRIGLEYNGYFNIYLLIVNQGFLISRFIWMSLTGFEMCRSLYRGIRMLGRIPPLAKWGSLAIYMLIGWGASLVLTIIMVAVEVSGGDRVRMIIGVFGYLTNHVPIALTQLTNIAVVIFISVVIITAARRQKRLQEYKFSKQNVNFVRLFIVLLTVLGLVWLFFFILTSVRSINDKVLHPAVIITYVIVTDSQPIFVCVAFLCTPKIFKMCLVRLRLKEPEISAASNGRRGTIMSTYSSSGELERRNTKTSILSFKSVNSIECSSPTLKPITEEDEEEEESEIVENKEEKKKVTIVENGNQIVANGRVAPNGALPKNTLLSQLNNGALAGTERDSRDTFSVTKTKPREGGSPSPAHSQCSSSS